MSNETKEGIKDVAITVVVAVVGALFTTIAKVATKTVEGCLRSE